MSTEDNKKIVTRFYTEVLGENKLDVLDEIATSDYDEHDPLPNQGEGIAGLKNRVTMLHDAFKPTFKLEDVIAEGDKVVVRWTNTGTHVGEFMGMAPTGKTYSIAGIDIYKMQDGHMAEHWHVVDMLSQLQQLGVIPAPQ